MGSDIWQLFNYRELVLIINVVLDFIVYVPFIVGLVLWSEYRTVLFLLVNEPLNTISMHAGLNLCYPIVSLKTLIDNFRCF
mgnify:CR=1 FL=1